MLKQATLWAELHDMHVYERFNAPMSTRKDAPACPITLVLLSQLPSRDTLREITITVSPRCSRAARRTEFLHALGNAEGMDEFLLRFSNLVSLHFDISELSTDIYVSRANTRRSSKPSYDTLAACCRHMLYQGSRSCSHERTTLAGRFCSRSIVLQASRCLP